MRKAPARLQRSQKRSPNVILGVNSGIGIRDDSSTASKKEFRREELKPLCVAIIYRFEQKVLGGGGKEGRRGYIVMVRYGKEGGGRGAKTDNSASYFKKVCVSHILIIVVVATKPGPEFQEGMVENKCFDRSKEE